MSIKSFKANFCSQKLVKNSIRKSTTLWNKVPMAVPDPIQGLNEAFEKDKFEKKVLLGMATFRDQWGKTLLLPCVRLACDRIYREGLSMEYLPIDGDPRFCLAARNLIFGENNTYVKENLIATVQTISGTGALNLAGIFLSKHWPGRKIIHVSRPTWLNHRIIFHEAGLQLKDYRYLKETSVELDFEGIMDDLDKIPDESIVLMQACAHNPTGLDPSQEQWKEIAQLARAKNALVVFDLMYQGLVSGNLADDAFAPRHFIECGVNVAVATCFAKNMGLYGERIGALCFNAGSKEEVDNIFSQLKMIIRARYSNPPKYGARIVCEILSDKHLYDTWIHDLSDMTRDLQQTRVNLHKLLIKNGSKRNWDHILKQTGMFVYSGLNSKHIENLINKFHIYIVHDGRMSISGLNKNNIEYVAKSIHEVTK